MDDKNLRSLTWQTANAAAMTVGFLKSAILADVFDPTERKIGETLLRSLEGQVAKCREYLANSQGSAGRRDEYLSAVARMAEHFDWISVAEGAHVIESEGGAYVEALVWVSEEEVEEINNGRKS